MSIIQGIWITLGPSTVDCLDAVVQSGVAGIRLTFSYGGTKVQLERALMIRKLSKKYGVEVRIMADLPGNKPRVSDFDDLSFQNIPDKSEVILVHQQFGASALNAVPVRDVDFLGKLVAGHIIIVGDGDGVLEVINVKQNFVICKSIGRSRITRNRGLTIQESDHRSSFVLPDDDLLFLRDISNSSSAFDIVALSFVSSKEQIQSARSILNESNDSSCSKLHIMSKIESVLDLHTLESVISHSDSIMIARGDLGLATGISLYKECRVISSLSQKLHVPWMIATQVLENMRYSSFPSRAELCDFPSWIERGCTSFLLSYETCFGERPLESIQIAIKMHQFYNITQELSK